MTDSEAKMAAHVALHMQLLELQKANDPRCPYVGAEYLHYKGGHYVVVAIGIREDTLVPFVVYRSMAKGLVLERTLENWLGGVKVERYANNEDVLWTERRFQNVHVPGRDTP